MKLKDQCYAELAEQQFKPLLEQVEAGTSCRELAARMYEERNGSSEIAAMMTDNMIRVIEAYHEETERCLQDSNRYLQEELDYWMEDLESPAERCEAYYRMLVAIAAYLLRLQGREEEADAYEERNQTLHCTEQQAQELELQLRQEVLAQLEKSQLLASMLPKILQTLEEGPVMSLNRVVRYGRESRELKLLMCMQMYLNASEGLYDLGSDISTEQIVKAVCGAVDTAAVAGMIEDGTISQEEGQKRLGAIGKIVQGSVLMIGAAVGAAALSSMLLIVCPIPLSLVLVLAVCALAWCRAEQFLEKIGLLRSKNKNWLKNGLKKLTAWINPVTKRQREDLIRQLGDREKPECVPPHRVQAEEKDGAEQLEKTREAQPAENRETAVQPAVLA